MFEHRLHRRSSWFAVAAVAVPLSLLACGDDHGHGDDDDDHHGPDSVCGHQENCPDFDPVELEEDLIVDGDDEVFKVHVVEHDPLTVDDNAITIMIMDESGAVADADVKVGTYSLDCGHPGPTPPETVTTDAMGLAEIEPVYAHGGPWDIELEVSEGDRTDEVKITLCVPGADHGGN